MFRMPILNILENHLLDLTKYQIKYPGKTIVMYVFVTFQCYVCMLCRIYEVLYFISNSI